MATKTTRRIPWHLWNRQRMALLREHHRRSGMTHDEVAELAGVTRWTVSRWFCGVYAPSFEHLYSLAVMWGVEVRDLMPPMRKPAR